MAQERDQILFNVLERMVNEITDSKTILPPVNTQDTVIEKSYKKNYEEDVKKLKSDLRYLVSSLYEIYFDA
jgi:hypothetical protein